MSDVLVINTGSSSLKYQLIGAEDEEWSAKGLVERIGEAGRGRAPPGAPCVVLDDAVLPTAGVHVALDVERVLGRVARREGQRHEGR